MDVSFGAPSMQYTRMGAFSRGFRSGPVFSLNGQQQKKTAAGPTFSVNLDALSEKKDGSSAKKADRSLDEIYDEYIERQKNAASALPPGGVATRTPINWDADGTSSLTEDQIEHLRSVYDLSHMDEESYWNLMADLSDMNVISARDIASQCVAKLPSSPVTTWYTMGDNETFGAMDHSGNLMENIAAFKKDLDLMMGWLKDQVMMGQDQLFQMRDDILYKSAWADRFTGIFQLLDLI